MWWKYEIFLDEKRARRIFTTYVAADSALQADEKIAEELTKYDILLYPSAGSLHLGDSPQRSAGRGRVTDSPEVVVIPYVPVQQPDQRSGRKLN